MNSVTLDGVVRATFKYSAEGHQTVRNLTYKGIVVHAVHDLDGNRIAEYRGDSGALLAEYIWLNGQLVAAIADGIVFYARTDHIGRPMFSTIVDGTVIGTGSWEPFGALHASTGPALNLRFPGQWFGGESGLNQNWMRDYDPTLGRYIQADPLGLVDGASVYGYARQSPNRYVDPTGEFFFTPSPGAFAKNSYATGSGSGSYFRGLYRFTQNHNNYGAAGELARLRDLLFNDPSLQECARLAILDYLKNHPFRTFGRMGTGVGVGTTISIFGGSSTGPGGFLIGPSLGTAAAFGDFAHAYNNAGGISLSRAISALLSGNPDLLDLAKFCNCSE